MDFGIYTMIWVSNRPASGAGKPCLAKYADTASGIEDLSISAGMAREIIDEEAPSESNVGMSTFVD